MKHEGAERERDVTGGHYNSGVVGSRTRSNGSLIFPLYICSLRCFIFFFGFHKCKYFTVQNDKCIFVDEEDVARRDVYIGPSRTVAPSTQNKNRFFYFIFLLEKEILCRYFACLRRAARGGQKSRNAHKKTTTTSVRWCVHQNGTNKWKRQNTQKLSLSSIPPSR